MGALPDYNIVQYLTYCTVKEKFKMQYFIARGYTIGVQTHQDFLGVRQIMLWEKTRMQLWFVEG